MVVEKVPEGKSSGNVSVLFCPVAVDINTTDNKKTEIRPLIATVSITHESEVIQGICRDRNVG